MSSASLGLFAYRYASRRQTLCASPHSQPSSFPRRCPIGVSIERTYISNRRNCHPCDGNCPEVGQVFSDVTGEPGEEPPRWAEIAYEAIAPAYDDFTAHHDYDLWLGELLPKLEKHGIPGRRLLDV